MSGDRDKLRMDTRPKYLVLFDLNGTLVCKTTKKIKCDAEPDVVLKKAIFIYFRPYIHALLSPLLKNPLVKIGIYSSMKVQNIDTILRAMLEKMGLSDKRSSILIFDAHYCISDPYGEELYDTLKDLTKVWNSEIAQIFFFNKRNTIFIENNVRKANRCIGNFIRMVSYEEKDIEHPCSEKDSLLEEYCKYIEKLISSKTTDVVEYLNVNSLPLKITKYFDRSTDELLKLYNNLAEAESKIPDIQDKITWKTIEELEDKEEKIKEMKNLISKIELTPKPQNPFILQHKHLHVYKTK